MNENLNKQENKYQLNYQTIKTISNKYNICNSFIDLFNSKYYKGKRHMHNGRVIIQLPTKQGQQSKYIIIDKDHTTRYLVQKIVTYASSQSSNKQYLNIVSFQGYKMELNKYMIHGFFQLFEMTNYKAYYGFEYIEQQSQAQGKHLLFCKIKVKDKYIKHNFDQQLKCIKQIAIKEQSMQLTEYFSQLILDTTLQKLNRQDFLSTIIINYSFSRLMYSYYSQFWYQRLPLVKIFQSQSLATFFFCTQNSQLDYQYFKNQLLDLYQGMNKNPLLEQFLLLFPIYQKGQAHFVLGTIKTDNQNNKIYMYELDPLESPTGTWRNKLQHIVNYIQIMAKQNNISLQYERLLLPSIKSIYAPPQIGSSDCGIYIFLYALLIMEQSSLINLHQEFKSMLSEDEKSRQLIRFIRRYLYFSYKHRDMYFLDGFQSQFLYRFNQCKFN